MRELRLIAELAPRYNRRSRHPDRAVWVKLTAEAFPRLSVVRQVRDDVADGAAYLGPFGSRRTALEAVEALQASINLRTCTPRISPRRTSSACVLAEMGRCPAPCVGEVDVAGYAPLVETARRALVDDVREVEAAMLARLRGLAADLRYEEAALWRDRLETFAQGAAKAQEISSLAAIPELVAARPTAANGWEVHVVRHGRLAGATTVAAGVDPRPVVAALVATAEQVAARDSVLPAALVEETTRILRWLETPGRPPRARSHARRLVAARPRGRRAARPSRRGEAGRGRGAAPAAAAPAPRRLTSAGPADSLPARGLG